MIVLAYHTNDQSTAQAIRQEAADVARNATVVCRNGHLFDGVERRLGTRPVVAVYAPHHPHIVEAYEQAGIPALDMTTAPLPVPDDAPVVVLDDSPASSSVPPRRRRG